MTKRTQRMLLRRDALSLALAASMLSGLSCGGDGLAPPTAGSIEITTSTGGAEQDADGYTVQMDAGSPQAIAAAATLTTSDVTPGDHTLRLGEVAANCTVAGDNPRMVSVTAGQTVTVGFAVACAASSPTTGIIRVSVTTSGSPTDPDGYIARLDHVDPGLRTATNGTVSFTGVPVGSHTVALTGMASNCSVTGEPTQTTTTVAGSTSDLTFAVTCAATTGSLQITTTTTGNALDPDGYTVTVDNRAPESISVTGSLTVPTISPGTHHVTLGGLATNCRVEGDNPRSVTVTAAATTSVSFSIACPGPQGSRIAFRSSRDGNGEIYVMSADGTEQTRLTNTSENESEPAWSPDGTHIAYSRRDDIYIMNADGTNQRNVTNHPASNRSPTWSPDGTRIAFVSNAEPEEQYPDHIMVINTDGSGLVQLTTREGVYRHADWSRDGSRIAFEAWIEEHPSYIGFMNADGSGGGLIEREDAAADGQPSWSTDGRLAFASTPHVFGDAGENEYPEDYEIHLIGADGTGETQLTSNSEEDLDPAWSRDDRKIAFTRYQDGSSDIYVMNADGSGETRLTTHPADDSNPSWSP